MIIIRATPSNYIGEILALGRHNGAYVNHYRIVQIEDDKANLVPVERISVHNTDGTYSTLYVEG